MVYTIYRIRVPRREFKMERKVFFNKVKAINFRDNLIDMGIEGVTFSYWMDGFGQTQYIISWEG